MDAPDSPSSFNPYQTSSDTNSQLAENQGEAMTLLSEMSKWQFFMAILLIIGLVLMLGVMAIQLLALGGGNASVFEALFGLACVGGVGLLFYGLPALLLIRASQSARNFVRQQGTLVEFARNQMMFWRVIGILIVLGILGYILIIAFAFVGLAAMG
jgi:hypothetical protein